MKDLLPKYFSSAWSFAQFKVAADCRCICAFGGEKNTVIGTSLLITLAIFASARELFAHWRIFRIFSFRIVICADGSFYRFMFDPQKGGECVRESYNKFLKESDDD